MTPEQFCYWLQGRAELQPDTPLSAEEWKKVVDRLLLVLNKEVPLRGVAAFDAAMAQRQRPSDLQDSQPLIGRYS